MNSCFPAKPRIARSQRSPITITTRALPSAYAYNVPVSADTHSLREEDADCLRLAAAELLRYVPDAARTLSDAIDDLACHPRAYRMSLPERWVILVSGSFATFF